MTSTLTLNKDETRTQQFTVFAPSTYSEVDEFPLVVYIENENVERQQVEVSIKKATISLTLDTDDIATESDLIAGKSGAVRVPVENTGLLDAPSVIVYLTPPNGVELAETISIPANSVGTAVFDGLTFNQGNQRFDYRIEVAGAESASVESIPEAGDFPLEYNVESTADGESIWMTLLIVVLGLLVIYGGVRTARSRGGTRF
jgi:hypothetical protein